MSLNRNQTMLCAIGGAFAVGAAALGWFLWSAIGERGEALDERDDSRSQIEGYASSSVAPTKESLNDVISNKEQYEHWREDALKAASRGDKTLRETTPPSFKQFLQSEQIRLSALPGGVNGKICAVGFAFGFEKYLGQNQTMPDKDELPKLQRQLDFIAEAVEIFSEAGVSEVKVVKRDMSPSAPVEEEVNAARSARRRNKGNAAVADEGPLEKSSLKYEFQFLASPKALVGVMNKLNSGKRFTVVEELNFTSSRDLIVENFAEHDKALSDAKNSKEGGGRRRRRRGEDAELAAEEEADKPATGGIVIDPEIDAPLVVDMTVKVSDFGTNTVPEEPAATSAEAAPEAEKPAAEAAPEAEKPAAEAAPEAEKPAEAAAPEAEKAAEPAEEAKEEAAK